MAPVQWLQRVFPAASVVVTRKGQKIEQHDLVRLLNKPNSYYGEAALWMATVFSWCTDGNAYWIKIRNSFGDVIQLWYVPHWMIRPARSTDSAAFIDYYEYRPGGARFEIPVEDVVHFRHGINPNNPLEGIAPLRSCMREAWSDGEASSWVASLLKNSGVPGVVVSPDGTATVAPGDPEAVKKYISDMFSGEHRGEPLVMSGPTKVSEFGYDPKKMDLSVVRNTAEERVCACFGIPAAVVGFGTGLETTKVGATMHEFTRIAWTDGVQPVQRSMSSTLGHSLLPDFEERPSDFRVSFDYSQVEALRGDQTALYTRANIGVANGWLTVSEAKRIVGIVPEVTDDVYLRGVTIVEVPLGLERDPSIFDEPKHRHKLKLAANNS